MAELRDVHALAHVARMVQMFEAAPDHPGTAPYSEYSDQQAVYRLRWRALSPEQRVDVIEATRLHGEVSEEHLNAAIAAMER